jgi:hypothetical protein
MGKGKSEWVEIPTIGDLTGIEDLLSSLPFDQITGSINALVTVLQSIQALLDIADTIIAGVEDINKAVFEAAVKALEILKDEIVDILRSALNFGLYVLPQVEAFDFQKAARNEILGGGITPKSFAPSGYQDETVEVPNKDNPRRTHFEVIRRQGGLRDSDYGQFIQDVVGSFNDPNDVVRPIFDSTEKLSAVTLIAASDDLARFIVAYLLIVFFTSDDKEVMNAADRMVRILRIAVGEQEFLGRQFDDGKKTRIQQLIDALEVGLEKGKENSKEFIKELFGLFDEDAPQTLDSDVKFNGDITVTGEARDYQVFDDDVFKIEIADETLNQENLAKVEIKTSGNATLDVVWDFGDGSPITENLGSGQNTWDIWMPLQPVGSATYESQSDDSLVGTPSGISNKVKPLLDGKIKSMAFASGDSSILFQNVNSKTASLSVPTTATFTLTSEDGTITDTRYIAVPKFNRLTLEETANINDGYRQNVTFKVEPSGTANKRRVAEYLGVSVDQVKPITTRRRETDFTRFGPDFREVDITLTVTPQINLNDSFSGILTANGKRYTPDDIVIRTRSADLKFKGVNLSEGQNGVTMLSFTSEIRTPVFVKTGSNDNGTYTNIHT